jgi:hypothetical protein
MSESFDKRGFDTALDLGGASPGDWMSLHVLAPAEVISAVLRLLSGRYGFRDIAPIDWCEMEREQDFAYASYSPADEPGNRYRIDWRKGETRGDIIVEVQPSTQTTAAACRNPDHEHFPGDPVVPSCTT